MTSKEKLVNKKKKPVAEYILLDKNDPEDFDYLTKISEELIEYRHPEGYMYTLSCTGNGLVFESGGKKLVEVDYAEAAALMHMLKLYNEDNSGFSMVRHKLTKDEK